MSLQNFKEVFLSMSSFLKTGLFFGAAAILLAVVSLLLPRMKPSRRNMSKGERAKEMKQAFQLIEKQHQPSNGTASMKVSDRFLQKVVSITDHKMNLGNPGSRRAYYGNYSGKFLLDDEK